MEQITHFLNSNNGQSLLLIIGLGFIILIVSSIFKKIIPKYIKDTNSRYRTRKFINLIAYVLLIIAVLTTYSNQLTGFAVFLGVAGAGVAFALQEVIAAIAGFIVIHTSNFYKVGDRVLLGGIKGDVIDIGFLRTTLMEIGDWVDGDLYNGRITTVSNNFIFKEPVFNYSGEFPFIWDEVKIPIRTEGDFEWAKEEFTKILKSSLGTYEKEAAQYWDKMTVKFLVEKAKVEPLVTMVFDENWITFTLRYVVDYKARRITKDLIFRSILKMIKESNGRIDVAASSSEVLNVTAKA
ncbi:MAG: mechanosensitive ion channel [Flavobacteriales bacterium]|nr:mechanosensitive ion channel [Flavobacteriales bacterium]